MMRSEIRHAIRALSRDRAFAAMVVLSLAVGIGANTAIAKERPARRATRVNPIDALRFE